MVRAAFDPHPAHLWTLTRDDQIASCDVRFVRSGVEVRVLRKGTRLFSRIFDNGDDALTEAREEQLRMLADGWQVSPV